MMDEVKVTRSKRSGGYVVWIQSPRGPGYREGVFDVVETLGADSRVSERLREAVDRAFEFEYEEGRNESTAGTKAELS